MKQLSFLDYATLQFAITIWKRDEVYAQIDEARTRLDAWQAAEAPYIDTEAVRTVWRIAADYEAGITSRQLPLLFSDGPSHPAPQSGRRPVEE